jgi:ABC-type uncharacterized transport system substrate-binding protein
MMHGHEKSDLAISEVQAKRLGLLHELVPKAVRIVVLVNPTNTPSTESTFRAVPEAARAMGLEIQILNATTSREIEAAFRRALLIPLLATSAL